MLLVLAPRRELAARLLHDGIAGQDTETIRRRLNAKVVERPITVLGEDCVVPSSSVDGLTDAPRLQERQPLALRLK